MLGLADMDQATDQIAHHVMQKCVCAELEQHKFAVPPDFSAVELLDGGFGLAFRGTEGAEIVLTE